MSSGDELVGKPQRRRPRVVLVAVTSAVLAAACTVAVLPWVPPAGRVGPQRLRPSDGEDRSLLLSEVAVETRAGASDDMKAAQKLIEEAARLKKEADTTFADVEGLRGKVKTLRQDAAGQQQKAMERRSQAEKAREQAQASRQEALALLEQARQEAHDLNVKAQRRATEIMKAAKKKAQGVQDAAAGEATTLATAAKALEDKATHLNEDAVAAASDAAADVQNAKAMQSEAAVMKSKATQENRSAVAAEQQALDETAVQRTCIGLPGVRLRGEKLATFDTVAGQHDIADDWQCNDWCLRHSECQQSVFTWESKTCELFRTRTSEPLAFRERWPWHNSSYCGPLEKKADMLAMMHKVYDVEPEVAPPHNCSWGGENCLHTRCCADVCEASWDYTTCEWFTCYQKDENFAGCKKGGPPSGWNGTKLGGHPNGEIAPAPKGKLVQGTTLYCFTVVMWSATPSEGWMDTEGAVANNWKDQKKGIMQCDDYTIFDGLEGGSVHNIQSFIRAWKLVKEDGHWKRNDWSIKVDPDAVFFPDHFRRKVEWVYRTPQGSAVYLRNTFYKFKFLGALEALTREAVEVYFASSWACETHLGQEGGEDYWLLQCLEGLGVDYQTDEGLLHDKYASDQNCADPNGVAFHFYKKIAGNDGWDTCWNTANEAWNKEHPE